MKELEQVINAMLEQVPAIKGAAVVAVSTGLVLYAAGDEVIRGGAVEAASEYWRPYLRYQETFAELGPLRYCVMMHQDWRMTLMECADDMLLLLLTRNEDAVDWSAALAYSAQVREVMRNA